MEDPDSNPFPCAPSATWVLPINNAAMGFLEAAANCLPGELTVCFEHAFTAQAALKLYDANRSHQRFEVERNTLAPETELHFCRLTVEFAQQLARLASEEEVSELFWHITGFDDERLVLWIHDAYGESSAYLSGLLAVHEIRQLSSKCGVAVSHMETSTEWDRVRRVLPTNKNSGDAPLFG